MKRDRSNLDFMRLAAAGVVLMCHSFALLNRNEPFLHRESGYGTLSEMAVGVFFSISGYLIAQSWDHDPDPFRFLGKRLLRIVPGLAVVVFLAALVLGPIVTTLPVWTYISSDGTLAYLKTALVYPTSFFLPGVYESNPFPGINGSLWTLSMEFTMYLVMAAIGIFTPNKHARLVALLAALGVACVHGWSGTNHVFAYMGSKILANFAIYFLIGALLFHTRPRFLAMVSASIVAAVFVAPHDMKHPMVQLGLPYVALTIGLASAPVIRDAARFGDFSYGAYIYAFPVQETLIHCFPSINPWPLAFFSLCLTACFAIASWHFVEKPALSMRKYISRQRTTVQDAHLSTETPINLAGSPGP